MTAYLVPEVDVVLGQVALEYSHKFRGVAEHEDISQELWLWCHRKANRIEANLEKESFQPWLRTSLRNAARDYIASIRNSSDSLMDQEHYNLGQIELLLPAIWDDDYLLGGSGSGDQKVSGGGDPSTGGNYLVSCLDVRRVYPRLSSFYQELLRLKYHEDYYYSDLAEHFDRGVSTMQYHVTKALKMIQRELGGSTPYEGGRKAISNAHAAALTRNQYDGE